MGKQESPEQAGKGGFFLAQEVKEHDREDDLWMIIYNNVYNITSFIDDHPGGVEVLLDCGGIDVTEAFEDVGHSDDALRMLTPYYLGQLIPQDCMNYTETKNPSTNFRFHTAQARDPVVSEGDKVSSFFWFRKHKDKLGLVCLTGITILALLFYSRLQLLKWNMYSVQVVPQT